MLVLLQLSLLRTMWLTYRKSAFSLGLAIFVSTLTTAMAGNCLETPFGAIPFYCMMGMCAARQGPEPAEEEYQEDEWDQFGAPQGHEARRTA